MGTILAYNGKLKDIPKKWALCDGNNGTPNLTGRFLQGWGSDGYNILSVGSFLSPGLPNITGYSGGLYLKAVGSSQPLGAMFIGWNTGPDVNTAGAGVNSWEGISFDASRCSPIYGASKTVQPRSYIVYYIMKIQK